MKKLFCDICDNEITTTHQQYKVFRDISMINGGSELIKMNINTSFISHPSGFCGPPDLCMPCFIQLMEDMIKDMKIATT